MAQRQSLSVDDLDSMSVQERADEVRSGVVRSWDDVTPADRDRIEAKAAEIELARFDR